MKIMKSIIASLLSAALLFTGTSAFGVVAEGEMNTEIAQKLYISRHTVKSHLYNIYKKIKVTNRLEAALWANKNLHDQP